MHGVIAFIPGFCSRSNAVAEREKLAVPMLSHLRPSLMIL